MVVISPTQFIEVPGLASKVGRALWLVHGVEEWS
jgi:hypothetical protein